MKVSIEKELERHSQVKKEQYNLDPLNEVKLLLNGESTEDARILRGLSNNSQFNRVEKIRGEQLELEKLEQGFQGKVYTKNEVKQLAIDYHLRFLPSIYYTGVYDVEVSAKIKEFAKNTGAPIDEWSLGRRFYILAPATMFELKEEKYISKRMQDPAIFFQIDENHYRLIHKWGSDFTIFRYLEGFRWKSWWSYQMFNTFLFIPLITLLWFMCFESPASQFDNHLVGSSVIISIVSFVLAYFTLGIWKQDELEAIHSFFSYGNWDSDKKIKR